MSDYLAFIYGGIERADPDRFGALKDGRKLAEQCMEQLARLDPARFPPSLLILLASPGYIVSQRAKQLVDGIHQTFAEQSYPSEKLIGSSVAAVFFKRKVYPEGALLVCLASRLLDVSVASASIDGKLPEVAAKELLEKLELDSDAGEDPNPFANRSLLAFLPGNRSKQYLAAQLHDALRERLWARVPIIGGVSSGFDGTRFRAGVQFANQDVNRDLIAAARVTTQTLFGMSVSDKLERTNDTISITALGADPRTVIEFDDKPGLEVIRQLQQEHGFVILGKRTFSGEPVMEMPFPLESTSAIRLLREADPADTFRVLKLNPATLSQGVSNSITRSCNSIGLKKPVGCLGFRCSGYFASHATTGLSLTQEIEEVEALLKIDDRYVGGFVDGEAGRDVQGRSRIRSWSTSAIVFGDELRHRTSFQRAFIRLAEFLNAYPSRHDTQESSIEALLQIIYEIGFPGARLALAVEDNAGRLLVTPNAEYAFGSLALPETELPWHIRLDQNGERSAEPAAVVEVTKSAEFFRWGPGGETSSYYVVPLRTIKHTILAVLQIDVGKTERLQAVEQELLTHLGTIVGASLTRILNWGETTIRVDLHNALKSAIAASKTIEGVDRYLEGVLQALGLRMVHVRIADRINRQLCLYTGRGDYFEAASTARPVIGFDDVSHTASTFTRDSQASTTIINDAQNDPSHLKMIEEASGLENEHLREVLERIGSYANVRFESEYGPPMSGKRVFEGTVNLLSEHPWFFKDPRRKVLGTISDQLGFLITHLEQKNAEIAAKKKAERASEAAIAARKREEEVNRRLEFLLKVAPQLADQRLADFEGTLTTVLDRFCEKVRATVGSIYLWDVDRNLYVLRAQHGWKEPKWVNTATYTKEASWFAARELAGEPRHLTDLFGYYEEKRQTRRSGEHPMPGGLYAKHMFGEKLSPTSNVEVLGLPLKIGQKEIGVLAMYRPIIDGEPSGFLETVIEMVRTPDLRAVLIDAISNVSGLVDALLQHQDDETDAYEEARREGISDLISDHIERESEASFPDLICDSVAETYGAHRVTLHSLTWRDASTGFSLKSVVHKPGGGLVNVAAEDIDSFLESAALACVASSVNDEELVQSIGDDAARATNGPSPKISLLEIRIRRKKLRDAERHNPSLAAKEGLVDRACLPLFLGPKSIWLLDLQWRITRPRTYAEEARLREKHLRHLSDDLSKFARLWIQTQKRIVAEKEALIRRKRQQELLGKLGVIAQMAHDWRGRIRRFEQLATRKGPAKENPDSVQALDTLAGELTSFSEDAFLRLALIKKESQTARSVSVLDLIGLTTAELAGSRRTGNVPCLVEIPKTMRVMVAKLSMQFAFENIIDNAIAAARKASEPRIVIDTITDPQNGVIHVRFTNNGPQIRSSIRDAINKGHYDELERWGLVIAACFVAQYDKGDLRIRTPANGDTVVIFTLPMASKVLE